MLQTGMYFRPRLNSTLCDIDENLALHILQRAIKIKILPDCVKGEASKEALKDHTASYSLFP